MVGEQSLVHCSLILHVRYGEQNLTDCFKTAHTNCFKQLIVVNTSIYVIVFCDRMMVHTVNRSYSIA